VCNPRRPRHEVEGPPWCREVFLLGEKGEMMAYEVRREVGSSKKATVR
jgi:hypothetical protein